jgi:hypothetical protein
MTLSTQHLSSPSAPSNIETNSESSETLVASLHEDGTSEKAIAGDQLLTPATDVSCSPNSEENAPLPERAAVSEAYTKILHNGGQFSC